MKSIKPLLVAGVLAAAGNAHAHIVEFRFTGTVTAGPLAPVGSQISGYFSYDTDTVPLLGNAGESLAIYNSPAPARIEANVNGHVVTTQGARVSVYDDWNGNAEDMIEIANIAPSVDGEVLTNGSFGIRLASAHGFTGALSDAALPTQIDLAAFNAGPTLTYGWLYSDGSQQGQRLSFSIDSIAAVPVPATAWLFGSGLLGLAGAARRRGGFARKNKTT